jgi:hypothetical protein
MGKHTPGKWRVSKPKGNCGANTIIAIHPPHFYFQGQIDKQTEADARLIASAPELLEACKIMLPVYRQGATHQEGENIVNRIEQTISKAEGGEK